VSLPTEIFTGGFFGGAFAPVSVFTHGYFTVSNYRPLLTPLDPASVSASIDRSKNPVIGPFRYVGTGGGLSPGAVGLETEPASA
jgi:hypothetical protein